VIWKSCPWRIKRYWSKGEMPLVLVFTNLTKWTIRF
jgi:hypothetical protein